MLKKSHIIAGLFIFLCSFQTQGNSDDHKVHGALLFGASIVAFKAFSSKIEFQNDVAGAPKRAQLATNEQFQKNIQRCLKDCEQLQQPKQAYATQDTASKSSQVQSIKNVDDELPIIDTQNLTDLIPTTATIVAPIIQQAIAIKPSHIQKISNENKAFLETFFTNRPSRQAIVPTSTIIATSLAHAAASLDSPSPTSVARVITPHLSHRVTTEKKYPQFDSLPLKQLNSIDFLRSLTRITDSTTTQMIESIDPHRPTTNKSIQQFTVTPNNTNRSNQKTIILPYVHGTYFSYLHRSGTQGMALENNSNLLALAQKIAIAENATVKLLCFQWNGDNSLTKRREAGVDLANEINNIRNATRGTLNKSDVSIWTISHSHGGSVVYHAAERLKQHEIKIDQAILFGCPIQDKNNGEDNITQLLNIYGEADSILRMGSGQQAHYSLQAASSSSDAARKNHAGAVNILLKTSGQDLTHHETPSKGLHFLPAIMSFLNNHYSNINHMIIDCDAHITTGCIHGDYTGDKATAENQELSITHAQEFTRKYKKSIHEKISSDQATQNEMGPLVQHYNPMLGSVTAAIISSTTATCNIFNYLGSYFSPATSKSPIPDDRKI